VAALLGPQSNAAFCPVDPITSPRGRALLARRDGGNSNGTVYAQLLGAGTNARVYALARPATSGDVPGFADLDVPLAVKIPTTAVAASGVVADVESFMTALPCWDRQRGDYACPIEAQAEALLSALASRLFTDGITPGTVVQVRAFVCPGPASERPLCLVQERLGIAINDGTEYVSTVERLPLFLDTVEGRPRGGLSGRMRRIESAAVEICVSVLHTLAVLQTTLGLNVLDVRPANLLLKVLVPGARYFQKSDTSAASSFVLAWPTAPVPGPESPATPESDQPRGAATASFVLPNRGWLVKVADMGMAAAYGVARLSPLSSSSPNSGATTVATVAVGTQRSSERISIALERRATDARALYETARRRAIRSGASASSASAIASSVLTDEDVDAIALLAQRLDERRAFGIEPRFMPGYDAHTLVSSMADACVRWIGRVPAPIAFLGDRLGYTLPAEAGGRPLVGAASDRGPIEALDALYRAALAGQGDAGLFMASYLAGRDDPRALVVQVPDGPVLFGNVPDATLA
jgi:hypothetical protein